MPQSVSIRLVHRYVPMDRVFTPLGRAALAVGAALWTGLGWKVWEATVFFLLVAACLLLYLGFLRTLTLIVNDEGLRVCRHALVEFSGHQ